MGNALLNYNRTINRHDQHILVTTNDENDIFTIKMPFLLVFSAFFIILLVILLHTLLFAMNKPEISVPYFTEGIKIDGNSSDWEAIKKLNKGISFYKGDGAEGMPEKPGTTICRKIDGEKDCHVDLWLAHDGNHLYVLAEVKDDAYEPFDKENVKNQAYLEDTLHLYIDSNNSKRYKIPGNPIQHEPGYEQFGISTDENIWGENVDFNNAGPEKSPSPKGSKPDGKYWQAACKVKKVTDGYLYTFEESILLRGWPGKNMLPY